LIPHWGYGREPTPRWWGCTIVPAKLAGQTMKTASKYRAKKNFYFLDFFA